MTVAWESEEDWDEKFLKWCQMLVFQEAFEQGVKQGMELEKRRMIPRLLANEFSIEEIAYVVEDSVAGVIQIIQSIQEEQGRSPEELLEK